MQASWKRACERVRVLSGICLPHVRQALYESRSSGLERKLGGNFHLKLNICSRPIENKYHEGKVKRTLKRVLKVSEIAEVKANGTNAVG
jgi:hypothetical protein